MIRNAIAGDTAAMIFYLKAKAGWRETQFKGVRKITKGDASAILTYSMQAYNEIRHALSEVA